MHIGYLTCLLCDFVLYFGVIINVFVLILIDRMH